MGGISDEAIRERAYLIWEREGRPHGRDFEHWVQAQVEISAEALDSNGGAPPLTARPPRAAAAKQKTTNGSKPSRTAPRRKRA